MFENQRITFKSLLASYFIITQNKVEKNSKYCIDSEKVKLQAILLLKYTTILRLDGTWVLHYS